MKDLLIVGGGLAGCILALEAHARNLHFIWIISPSIPSASSAAYGICNPVHFRNAVPAWKAEELYQEAHAFFTRYQEVLEGEPFTRPVKIHHLLADKNELNFWRQHVETTGLWRYCSGDLHHEINNQVAPGYYGSVMIHESFYVSVPLFVQKVQAYFSEFIQAKELEFDLLEVNPDHIVYEEEVFKKIIFCDGIASEKNPYFKNIPYNPCKGETLVLGIPGLDLKEAVHKKIFLLPLEGDVYMCGATYEWEDLTDQISEKGRLEILEGLKEMIGEKYTVEVIGQKAGVRPAVSDRRPVVGWHPRFLHAGILNGFGSRGLMVGPSAARNLLENMQTGEPVLMDWNVTRFSKRLLRKDEQVHH